jgi:outer membrane protein TolC
MARIAYHDALQALKEHMRVAPSSLISLEEEVEVFHEPGQDLSFFLQQAGRLRPEIGESKKAVAEADDQVHAVSQEDIHTQLAIEASAQASEHAGGDFAGDGLIVLVPLSEDDQIALATLNLEYRKVVQKKTDLNVAQEVAIAWIDVDSARRGVLIAQDCSSLMDKERDASLREYKAGQISLHVQILVDDEVLEARRALLTAVYRYRVAEAQLIHASGSCYGTELEAQGIERRKER